MMRPPQLARSRTIIGAILAVGGLVWTSTALWPKATEVLPGLPALQASAFVGGILAVFGLALIVRARRALAVLAVMVLVVVIAPRIGTLNWFGPDPNVRVMALNTALGNADDGAIVDRLRELQPDLVSLSETTPDEIRRVTAATGFVAMSNAEPGSGGADGVVLLANPDGRLASLVTQAEKVDPEKKPEANHEYADVARDADVTRFQMPTVYTPSWHFRGSRAGAVAEVPVTFAGVHVVAPVGSEDRKAWDEELEGLQSWTAQRNRTTDVVLMGDFNATRWHPRMRDFSNTTDCTGHAAARPTWPAFAPVIRLDHILTTGSCGEAGTFRVSGTDHLGVWADIAFRKKD
ncbi:endonuclease/exonuclease/phosphatase family protein [Corynebacterium sp. 320]|nr:endonuclease/exonuclease/phosphatase family protein [Corynebacterium sp. 320]KAB1551036.1 endonuclease/exonuclease/phosphatase family protein [Corynebacterium sp. 319]KAB3526909.1 endonuclease/exonuclease/phosphatase family protein [Corynebacterium sp. 250]KAB3538402.1 endonuclease/exonuclease/phosphatase family protein [Corynebacterium sp. 366]QNP92477.1 endonuclease/exonuclease/phosphatase family protein [Corynebacterium zhongnanshanii]